jgi:macrodomain Ter protein organizer (MatP/YcbG family)
VKISKLDAARRQIETAVILYFHEGDPISIHTLAAAAYDVLRDVNKARDGPPMIKDWMTDYVKPESRTDLINAINAAQNFLKHADRDPDGGRTLKL